MSENREPASSPARRCAFCDAPWSARMTTWFGPERGCACCDGAIAGHWPIKLEPAPKPTEDLVCDGCGKTLYLAPKP
jgi:hypothetical protein